MNSLNLVSRGSCSLEIARLRRLAAVVAASFLCYDRPDQLQRPRTPDLENSRKTAEKGAEWPSSKVPGKQQKNSRTGSQTAEKQLFCTLRVFFWLFFGCFAGTLHEGLSAPFSAVFRLFSRSGVRSLCSWSGRS